VGSRSHSINDKYSIKEITNLNDFRDLMTIWDSLAERQGAYMPFLCFEWFKLWLDHFLKNNRLLILLLYKENEIVTIAPFLISEERFKGINVRKIDLIGNAYSPIRYFLFSEFNNEEKMKNISYIFEFFSEIYRNWDILDFYSIPEENDCFDILKMAIKQTGLKHLEYFCFGDCYLDNIEYSGDEYFTNLPKKIRKDVSYCQRLLQKMGNFEFKLINNGDLIHHHMDLYYEVYSKSWQQKEGIGPTFHRDLAKMAARNGWLRLGFLFLNNYPISSQFWISCNDTAFIMKTVYDQDYKKFSPGKILTAEMMKYVIDIDKVKTVDYLQGDESYKQDWMPGKRERKGILFYNNNMKGNYLAVLNNRILPLFNKYKSLKKIKGIIVNQSGRNP